MSGVSRQLNGQVALVTGASGFIGSELCRRLCEAGATVHAVSRKAPPSQSLPVRWWSGDLCDLPTVFAILESVRPEVIFHLAGRPTGNRESREIVPTFRGNLLCTVNILTAAVDIGCRRIILAGSMDEPLEEQGVACSPYAAAKSASGVYGRMFHLLYRLPVVILRIFMVYGKGQLDLTKLIPYVITSALRGVAPAVGSGRRQIDWINVEDVARSLICAALAPGIEGRTLDVGSGTTVPIRAIVERLMSLTNPGLKARFGALPDREFECERVADTATTARAMGWTPAIDLESGLRDTVTWYRELALAERAAGSQGTASAPGPPVHATPAPSFPGGKDTEEASS